MRLIRTLAATGLLIATLTACGTGAATQTPSASSAAASSPSGPSAATAAEGTPITVKDFALDPKDVTVQGQVSLAVTNAGPTVHNVSIRDASGKVLAATKDLKTGGTETLGADLPAGSYVLFCSLPGHESLGIKGTLTVTK